jgi:hypothetical protein
MAGREGRDARLRERLERVLVQVGHRDARGELRVVWVLGRHGRRGLRRELVELGRRDALVHAACDLLRDEDRVALRFAGEENAGEGVSPDEDAISNASARETRKTPVRSARSEAKHSRGPG